MRKKLALLVLLFGLVAARPARADFPAWMQEGKTGNWMFNFKIGPAFDLSNGVTQGLLAFEIGYAVTPDHNGYITLAPQFQVAGFFSWIIIPVGFQYDIPIKSVPGLYLTPAIGLGYAAQVGYGFTGCAGCGTASGAYLEPSFGGKLIFAKRWNVGFEPFSLPIFIVPNANPVAGGTTVGLISYVSYRILLYGGVNF
jgi:hypothetical protein